MDDINFYVEHKDAPWLVTEDTYWFKYKAMCFVSVGRRPRTVREWARCAWNADVFFGGVPFLKTVAVTALLVAWVA